jgi:hypothetical protein
MWFQNPFQRFLRALPRDFLKSLGSGGRRRPPARRRHGLLPRLQQLEVRTLPSSFTAVTVSDLIADINAANETPEADTITLAAGATFSLTEINNSTHGPTGLPVIAAGEDLTIIGNGDVIERSAAAGTPAFRLFDVAAGASLRLENATLQGGLATATTYSYSIPLPARGGAILNMGALTVNSVTVQNNTAKGSDSIYFYSYTGGFGAAGGGIYSAGSLTMTGCTIQNNAAIGGQGHEKYLAYHEYYKWHQATDGGDAFGGGLYVGGGTATITNTSITKNAALGGEGGKGGGKQGDGDGGGIYVAPAATVFLDTHTVDHLRRNKASRSDNDIAGAFGVIL